MNNVAPDERDTTSRRINFPDNPAREYTRIRKTLVMTIALLLIAMAALAGWNCYSSYQNAIRTTELKSASYARALKEHAERALSEAHQTLDNIAHQIDDNGGLPSLNRRELTDILTASGSDARHIGAISVADADGRMLALSKLHSPKLPNIANRAYFNYHREHSSLSPFIGPPFKAVLSNQFRFTLSRRINDSSGRFGGVITILFDISYFEKLYDSIVAGVNGRASLASLAGDYLVLIPNDTAVYAQGKKTAEFFRTRVSKIPADTYHNPRSNIAKQHRIVSYNRLDDYPVVAIVSFGKEEALAEWRNSTIYNGIVLIVFYIVAISMSLVLSRSLKEQEAANRTITDQRDELIQNEAQLRTLAAELEGQKQQLQQSNETLELRVQERTADLQEINTRFSQLAEQSRTVIWEVDARGCFTYISAMSEQVYGLQPDQVIGQLYFFDLIPLPEREEVTKAAFTTFNRKEAFVHFVHGGIRHNSNQRIWISTTALPLLDKDGTLLGYRGTDTDISETRLLQEQLNQAQKLESVGRLAGGIAHDFNNKLSVIMGYSLLARQELPDVTHINEYLLEITRAAEFSRDITSQLLAFSRQQIRSPQQLDINLIIDKTRKSLMRLLGEEIRLNFHPCNDLWFIWIDPIQIDQIIMNLSVNARDAMPGGGILTIETRNHLIEEVEAAHTGHPPGEYVMISVNDSGTGIDDETLKHIFEPFFTTKEVGKGTGLGLSTIHGIVLQNNGFIDVESSVGTGTTFRILFPRCRTQAKTTSPQKPACTDSKEDKIP